MSRFFIIAIVFACIHLGWRYFGNESQAKASDMSSAGLTQLASTVKQDEVVMYTTTHCPYCAQARSWLNQYGFAFTECDAEKRSECAQQLQALGGMGVPYLVVRGRHMKDGFDSDEFLSLLKN